LVGALNALVLSGTISGSKRQQLVSEARRIVAERCATLMSGDPSEDWLVIRRLFSSSAVKTIQTVADDAKYLRLLHKGATLRGRLGELWRAKVVMQGRLRPCETLYCRNIFRHQQRNGGASM
jgi:DNA helicase-2/ATP-dependent DNA helicase PcrA